MNRKQFIATLSIGFLSLKTMRLFGQARKSHVYELPKLPYPYNALEPHIDALTMEIHHSKHHQAYINALNKATDGTPYAAKSLEQIFADMKTAPVALRNHGGGHYNHSLFWQLLSPAGGGEPKAKLKRAITKQFGSLEAFKKQFEDAAKSRFGSGWAWLILQNGKLLITTTPNQDNPLMNVAEQQGKIIIGLDVWEHAYYLKHQNRRAEYIAAFWNVLNWQQAEKNYKAALAVL